MKFKLSPIKRVNVVFIVGTAAILLIALLIASALEFTFAHLDLINLSPTNASGWYWVLIFTLTSIIIGIVLAFLLGRIIFKPINKIVDAMSSLAEGDFSTRIKLGNYDEAKKIETSFNTLAEELEKTEILRSDFINEFSHELKTPIVSISGLIALMKSEELDEAEKKKYLAVMEEEANRLTAMTSNALYLSKLETQGILTNLKKYNVSEQIRSCVLLLERKWEKKELIPSLDFDEYELYANEDMIKEVWLNLIDNAIKFADKGSEFEIAIKEVDEHLHISVSNYGPEIPESEYKAIFGKFYQVEKSRSTEGNGIGLSIVKHILKLHKADITVESKNGKTTFTVIIKKDGSLQN